MDIRSRLIHAGQKRGDHYGASSVPIYQASTFDQENPLASGRYNYSRSGNPTREALEQAMADSEGGVGALAFASGMAAISSALLMFAPGDHIVVSEDIYGGTFRVLNTLFKRWQLEATFADSTDLQKMRSAIRPNTRALFIETPSNPLLRITDLKAIAGLAREYGLLAIADNTFMTPYLQRPLEHGFDLVLYSATKFIAGHSDVVAGLAVCRSAEIYKRLRHIQNAVGAILSPHDSWLVMRGLRTLAVRLEAQQRSAREIAHRLCSCRSVKKVFYPGLDDHPGRAIHEAQAVGPGAIVSFELPSREAVINFMSGLALPLRGVSLGGVESIMTYPSTMSHAAMPPAERHARGISDGLLRLSVGLENVEDLWQDLAQALS